MRLKFILLWLVAAMSATGAMAATLTPDQALARLSGDRSTSPAMSRASAQARLINTGKTVDGEPAYYIFSTESQTLFVSADDVAQPLLGYTESGDFDASQMPPDMKWWLSQYARQIAWAQAHPASGKPQLRFSAPQSRGTEGRTNIAPLCKTGWDQGWPYNDLCPLKNDSITYTGCVATGMAQAMKYFNYPAKGKGSNSYEWNGQTLSMDFASTTFDWNNMLNSYTPDNSNSRQQKAVATLMKACGYSVDMEYGTQGSSSTRLYIPNALINNFNYDKGTSLENRDYYSASQWDQMIYDNLKNVGPVIYAGSTEKSGHCFICDGYNTDGTFHINWGWSNRCDGYFRLDALNPPIQGIGGDEGGYNFNQSAILGMRKPVAGSKFQETWMAILGTLECTSSGRTLTFTTSDYGGFNNMGPWSADFSIGIQLTSTSKEVTVPVWEYFEDVRPGDGISWFKGPLPSDVKNGDYTARLVYKIDDGSWKPLRHNYGADNYVKITVDANSMAINGYGSDTGSGDETREVTVDNPSTSTGFVAGATCSVKATVHSTYPTKHTSEIAAYICEIEDDALKIVDQIEKRSVTIPAYSSVDVTFTGTLSSTLEPGKYYLAFAEGNKLISNAYSLNVTANDKGEISGTDYTAPSKFTVGQPATMTLNLKNTSNSSKTLDVKAVLCTLVDYQYHLQATLGTATTTIGANNTRTVTISGTVPSTIAPGDYYLVFIDSDGYILLDPSQQYPVVAYDAITPISADESSQEGIYYNMQGQRVTNPGPGIYLRRQGNKIVKVKI